MKKPPMELFLGTLDMLILTALGAEPRHGYGVVRWIRQVSGEDFNIEEGALYPAMHRMEGKGWVQSHWGTSENNRRARFYRITAAGHRQLQQATARWARYVQAVDKVLAAVGSVEPRDTSEATHGELAGP